MTDQPVLPNGGEIHFDDPEEDCHVPDRIEFLPGGFVMGVYKHNYEIIVYPPDDIRRVYAHTNHLEDEDWWSGEAAEDGSWRAAVRAAIGRLRADD